MDKYSNIKTKFTASIHTHVRSQFDAYIDARKLCAMIKVLGGTACAITDHGVLSSIEDYRRVFADNGLKFIPGCELYVDGGILGRLHLIVLARDDRGYRGICKIVTESNYNLESGFPIITEEKLFAIMQEYKGSIFALSACMQGIIPAIFLQNKTVEKKVQKLMDKMKKYVPVINTDPVFYARHKLNMAEEELKAVSVEVERAALLRDETKAAAEAKFAQREKAIAKAEKDGMDVETAKRELEADKIRAEKAKLELPGVKEELAAAKKKLTETTKAVVEARELYDKLMKMTVEMQEIAAEYKSDDELFELACKKALQYREVFGKSCFLIEVQYHGIPDEKVAFPKAVEVAKKLGIPLVATNDVHILTNSEDDRLRRQILRSMRFGDNFEEESVGDDQLYLKDNYELFDALTQIIGEDDAVKAINNIDVVVNACDVKFETGKHYPKYKEEIG